jgi:hypothetical protein
MKTITLLAYANGPKTFMPQEPVGNAVVQLVGTAELIAGEGVKDINLMTTAPIVVPKRSQCLTWLSAL